MNFEHEKDTNTKIFAQHETNTTRDMNFEHEHDTNTNSCRVVFVSYRSALVQTVKQVMRCMLEDRNLEKDAWPSILQETPYELNSMPNASTGYSPFRITYGQLATSKLLLQNKPSHVSVEDWCDEIVSRQTGTIREVGENLQEARDRMKRFTIEARRPLR